jgi:DNA modification methylase
MKILLKDLSHHPLNEKIYSLSDIEDLKESISKVGLLQPIIIDKKNRVISGNRRFQSIKELNWVDVEVIVSNIKESDVPLYLVSYNKQRVKTIKEQIAEVKILQTYYSKKQGFRSDLTSANIGRGSTREQISNETGISSGQIQKILFIDNHQPSLIELVDKGIMTINQAYLECNRKRIESSSIQIPSIKQSSLKREDLKLYNKSSCNLSEIVDEQIQLIFTSPPYWNKRIYQIEKGLGNEPNHEDYVKNLIDHFNDCYRVLNTKGSFFLNLGDTFLDGNLLNIPHRVVIGLQERGWILRNTIIWNKTNPKPSSTKTNLTPTYEFIFHLVKSKDYIYNPTKTPLSSNTKPSHPPRHRNIKTETIKSYTPYIPSIDGKNMGDFWTEEIVRTSVANQKIKELEMEHPAPFPKEIVILPLLQTTNPGDWVLDPFCGSGTTGRVSLSLERKFIGYDIQTNFIEYLKKTFREPKIMV